MFIPASILAKYRRASHLETITAKEDKDVKDCMGKPLDCCVADGCGIAMRTQWQSGQIYGNVYLSVFNGKPLFWRQNSRQLGKPTGP